MDFSCAPHPRDLNLSPLGRGTLPCGRDPGRRTFRQKSPIAIFSGFRNLWMGGFAYFFTGFTAYVVNIFIVTYANLELRFPFAQSASLASFIAFSGIPGALIIPGLSDYLGRKKCLLLLNLGFSAVILLLVWAGNSWPALVAAACLYGVIYTSTWPMYAAAGADFFPPGTTGSVLGFWTIFFGIGLILAPTVGGCDCRPGAEALSRLFSWPPRPASSPLFSSPGFGKSNLPRIPETALLV